MGAQQVSLSAVASRVWEIYRDQAGVLLGVAVILFAVQFVVNLALSAAAAILVALLFWVLSTLYQGMVVELVQDLQDGKRDHSVGDLLRSVGPVLLPLMAVGVLFAIGVGIGFILLIVPGLYLMTIWCVVAPVTVLEHPGVFAAFGRSRELVRGHGWAVFGVILGIFFAVVLVSIMAGLIASGLGTFGRSLVQWAVDTAVAPVAALAATVLYLTLRQAHSETVALGGRRLRPHHSRDALVLGSSVCGEQIRKPGARTRTGASMATDAPMQLGMVGLGRMGAGIVRRLMRDGHRCVGYDVNPQAVEAIAADGATGADSLKDFAAKLEKPRTGLGDGAGRRHHQPHDPGRGRGAGAGRRDHRRREHPLPRRHPSCRRARREGHAPRRLRHQRWRVRTRARLLPDDRAAKSTSWSGSARCSPRWRPASTARRGRPGEAASRVTAEQGYFHCGQNGAGHFVKMVHNGIEYGIMARTPRA